jgi:hypothetical protein
MATGGPPLPISAAFPIKNRNSKAKNRGILAGANFEPKGADRIAPALRLLPARFNTTSFVFVSGYQLSSINYQLLRVVGTSGEESTINFPHWHALCEQSDTMFY